MSLEALESKPLLETPSFRRDSAGSHPSVLTDVYEEETHLAVWQRTLSADLQTAADFVLTTKPKLKMSCTLTPESAYSAVFDALEGTDAAATLSHDVAQLVDMFCFMFDLTRAGLRMTVLDHAMCSRFHVDKVPCRLITTYSGIGTEWLPHSLVDRSKLGAGNKGKPDDTSGVFATKSDIQQLAQGDVALLKGEGWEHNEGAGLVHRSPYVPAGSSRLLLTLDYIF